MKQALSLVAIDLAKKVFHLVGTDTTGKMLWRKRLTRHALMPFIAQLPPVRIGIEACGGAHYWARRFRGGCPSALWSAVGCPSGAANPQPGEKLIVRYNPERPVRPGLWGSRAVLQ
jgi:hypothetical protein